MTSVNTGDLQAQSIVITILQKCIAEKTNNNLTIPVDKVQERVAFYTGISKNYINELCEDLQSNKSSLSINHRKLIIEGLLHFYGKFKLPTINELYDHLLEQTTLPLLAEFTREMAVLGYCYRKTTKGYLIMEDPALTFERFHYLKKILKFRKHKDVTIHYMDERLINEHCTFPKPMQNMNDKTLLESLLYCYFVSHKGIIEGLFTNYINRDEISNWIKYIVIPKLEPSSVIVISNNFLYGQQTNNPPSPYASKETMLKWLRTNNIPCNNTMRKADLYALITKFPPTGESCNLEFLFKAHGHEVLHLPLSLQSLTPTEKAWEDIKLYLQGKEIQNLITLKEYIHNYIKTRFSLDKWSEYEANVEIMEKSIFNLDQLMEDVLHPYYFETGDPLFECQLSSIHHTCA